MCDSLSIIFGVVPEETSAWNPEIAPHMMQMNTNGKMLPGNVGPPLTKTSLSGGACKRRIGDETPTTSRAIGADLQEAGEVVARAEQQPHRQHRGDEAVDAQRADRLVAW